MPPFTFNTSRSVRFGASLILQLGEMTRSEIGCRVLLVTDTGMLATGLVDQVQVILANAGVDVTVFSDVVADPPEAVVLAATEAAKVADVDAVIGFGGGSSLDVAKLVAVLAMDNQSLKDIYGVGNITGRRLPLILIPTTSGTGSEVTPISILTTGKSEKMGVVSPVLIPDIALLDPELTLGLPAHVTAATGIDAMVHAIEAYCVPGFNPLCDGLALEGLRLVGRWLPVAVAEPSNLEARGAMLAGSCLSGIAFLKGLGLVHSISHMVGAEYDTQHGLTNAVVLPAALRHNAPALADKIEPLSQAMGLRDTSFEALYAHVCAILDQVGIPKTLTDIGVPSDCAARIADKALQDSAAGTNACALTAQDIERVIAVALTKG